MSIPTPSDSVSSVSWLVPDWPLPPGVRCLITTRHGGASAAPYDSFNLATHVGDAASAVAQVRDALSVNFETVCGRTFQRFSSIDQAPGILQSLVTRGNSP